MDLTKIQNKRNLKKRIKQRERRNVSLLPLGAVSTFRNLNTFKYECIVHCNSIEFKVCIAGQSQGQARQ